MLNDFQKQVESAIQIIENEFAESILELETWFPDLVKILRVNNLVFGLDKEEMKIEVSIGVAKPEEVDADVVKAVLPYGKATVEVVEGGLDIVADCGTKVTVVANAAVVVYLNLIDTENDDQQGGA